jgi:hypothetical protein
MAIFGSLVIATSAGYDERQAKMPDPLTNPMNAEDRNAPIQIEIAS